VNLSFTDVKLIFGYVKIFILQINKKINDIFTKTLNHTIMKKRTKKIKEGQFEILKLREISKLRGGKTVVEDDVAIKA